MTERRGALSYDKAVQIVWDWQVQPTSSKSAADLLDSIGFHSWEEERRQLQKRAEMAEARIALLEQQRNNLAAEHTVRLREEDRLQEKLIALEALVEQLVRTLQDVHSSTDSLSRYGRGCWNEHDPACPVGQVLATYEAWKKECL